MVNRKSSASFPLDLLHCLMDLRKEVTLSENGVRDIELVFYVIGKSIYIPLSFTGQ
jgi:hypothetical protein